MSHKHRSQVTGYIKRHPDGFGFLIPDDVAHPDVYIPKHFMIGVMSNDRVKISVRPEPGGNRFRGKILEILERGLKQVTGQLHRTNKDKGRLLDTSRVWGEDLTVNLSASTSFKDGDWVLVEVDSYPGSSEGFSGHLIKVIGDSLDPNNDNLRVLYSHTIPLEFSESSLADCEKLSDEVREIDWADRKDLRQELFITIDGATAKDFDDAIVVETSNEGFLLKVAIADVSHYVKTGTPTDADAYARGTSTYLPNFVAPMLPEKLSNHLCSLRPGVPRLTVVADLRLNFQGEIINSKFYEAVIKSQARVTYGEAQEVIDGSGPEKLRHVEQMILKAADLAKVLKAKRFKEGSLNLEIPETVVEIDEAGQPVDIIKSERLFSHCMIEELMLVANVAVARFFNSVKAPALFRIHEPPAEEDIKSLERFMHNLGAGQSLGGGKLQKKISRALQDFHDRPEEHILHVLALRSMSQAVYSAQNIGHFGLGFADYVHFTSPIRRYPDLIIHRQLKACIYKNKGYRLYPEDQLVASGAHLSACEQRSVKAERQLISIKKARFMEKFVGHEFEGMISSVTRFGIFVLLRRFDVDGLVRLEDLGDDYFEFDEENLRLVGKHSGAIYSIGSMVNVTVAGVNSDEGQIDFVLAGRFVAPTPKARESGFVKRQKHHKKKAKSSTSGFSLKANRRSLRSTGASKPRGKGKAR